LKKALAFTEKKVTVWLFKRSVPVVMQGDYTILLQMPEILLLNL